MLGHLSFHAQWKTDVLLQLFSVRKISLSTLFQSIPERGYNVAAIICDWCQLTLHKADSSLLCCLFMRNCYAVIGVCLGKNTKQWEKHHGVQAHCLCNFLMSSEPLVLIYCVYRYHFHLLMRHG